MLQQPGDGDNSDVVWVCKRDGCRPAKEFDVVLLLDGGRIIEIIYPRVRDVRDHTYR